ncbi:MAG TPA: 3D-(3,5/4)-trihydroxycyclohexane-1,2-dione acylhydrolase (decyclizing) [Candidatus Acidoferrales bacterium]|jgi:3D-(3,5/4)-trihydroxycyclohexane-1,2-dione acylhydrolase (decyclizing)|nr:3D-(3,5/4)-trihydroxycyclohexane-1,2-dione acylhydrolase (decyclizing) [Candidatus Acidoferrales bacterium]
MTVRLTAAQATIAFLKNQYSERDRKQQRFFEGCLGIFGHGNVAGLGQALEQDPGLRYYLFRNEQAMVHAATAFAKTSFRLRALVCTSSIGPGATNMITGAATATVNRLPVLLLPGDIFARRNVAPVLQQLESPFTQDISANDCFKPVSRYWDRIQRPEQLLTALPEAMRVLTSPAETGAVTIAFPQDVQAEAFDFPEKFFAKKVWVIPRNRCDRDLLQRAAEWIRAAKKPLIVAGGGVLYSQATEALAQFAQATGIPVCETQAGKGSLPFDHPQQLGAVGTTGTPGANIAAREADLILGIGTRYSDFTSTSKTGFQNPAVRFININVAEFDAYKHAALALTGDARLTVAELQQAVGNFGIADSYRAQINEFRARWEIEVSRIYGIHQAPPITQGEVIGIVNNFTKPSDIVVCAAGSLPGDLHKLWRTREPGGYHMEYGFSCMGYEIAGGLGAKMADPAREVYVLVGDGSYLMMAQEIVTSLQEGFKINIVLLDNHGFSSIGGLSRACGNEGMGTSYRFRRGDRYDGDVLPVDFAANAASLGAWIARAKTADELKAALTAAREQKRTSVVVIETAYDQRVPGYESWWDVPIAEVSERDAVKAARRSYEEARKKERFFF